MSVEAKLNQILANQVTVLGNQANILTAVQAITPGGSDAISAALTQIETQVAAIQSTIGTDTDGTTPATTTPASTPAASS